MATHQLLQPRQKKKASKELLLFPRKIATEQQAMVVVKKLLATSVSCITYMRGLFPENSYGTRYLDDLCLKILREDKSCLGSLQIVKWIQGCFDALERQYLHIAILAIYTNPKEPETVTELYQFKFKYKKAVPQMDIIRWILEEFLAVDPSPSKRFSELPFDTILHHTHNVYSHIETVLAWLLLLKQFVMVVSEMIQPVHRVIRLPVVFQRHSNQVNVVNGVCGEDVKQASRLLIRKLYLLMQNLGPLPNDVTLTMKLLYYNDVTPNDYQPPGFKEDGNPGHLLFDGDPVNLRVGSVSTGFHLMKVRVITEKKRMGTDKCNLIQRNGPTEISHQGLDCDEEEEERSTKNDPLPVRADASEHGEDKSDTHPDGKTETSFSCQSAGRKKMGIKEMGRTPCSRASQQISCLNLAFSQEEVTGPKKKRKVSEPEKPLREGF